MNAQIRRVILITIHAWRQALSNPRGMELVQTLEQLKNLAARDVAQTIRATDQPLSEDMIQQLNRFKRESTIAFLSTLSSQQAARQLSSQEEEEEEEEDQQNPKPSTSTSKKQPPEPKKKK
jgi:L-lactate utilization protein LutC